ncbi:MAG: hypothetical protein MJ197_02290 [Bacteroidales bacterium]|nr:hypothetical protein [Bacteroidales bacterium]
MRGKILLSVAFAVGIAALVLMILDAAEQKVITSLLIIGLICVSFEFLASKNDDKDKDE